MLDAQQTPIAVRQATEADVPAIVDIYIRAYAQPPWYERHEPVASEGYLRWVMSQPGTFCLVSSIVDRLGAEGDPRPGTPGSAAPAGGPAEGLPPQGFVLAGARDYAEFVRDWERLAERPAAGWPPVPGRLGYIWEIAVHPDAQRRGQGWALLHAAVERLGAEGVETVLLRSSERAPAAAGLYRRYGFRRLPVSERVDPYSGPWVLPLR